MKLTILTLLASGAVCCLGSNLSDLTIQEMSVWKNGGTIGVEMTVGDDRLEFCFGGRLKTNAPCRLYVGATHPEHRGARLLGLGSKEADRILRIVRSHFDKKFSSAKQVKWIERGSYAPESQEEMRAWKILRMVRELDRQRKREQE